MVRHCRSGLVTGVDSIPTGVSHGCFIPLSNSSQYGNHEGKHTAKQNDTLWTTESTVLDVWAPEYKHSHPRHGDHGVSFEKCVCYRGVVQFTTAINKFTVLSNKGL